jgi:hypothetical protein
MQEGWSAFFFAVSGVAYHQLECLRMIRPISASNRF